MKTERRKGLDYLRIFGCPVPEIQYVFHEQDLARLVLGETSWGWTIRTCLTHGKNEIKLYSRNYLPGALVRKELLGKLLHQADEYYIVYPSWHFRFGANVLSDGVDFLFEGNLSSQESISKGLASPEIVSTMKGRMNSQLVVTKGHCDEDLRHWLMRIAFYLRKIHFAQYYAEVAVTTENKIIFYELWLL